MIIKIIRNRVCILLVFCFNFVFSQNNYHVSVYGNNQNNGLFTGPWRDIQFGLNQLNKGDILWVHPGVYNEKIEIPKDSITLRSYDHGVILDGTGISSPNASITISNKSNVSIYGLEISNNIRNYAQGILIEGSGENICIKRCRIHDIHFSSNPNASVTSNKNAQGIIVYGTHDLKPLKNIKIEGNELFNCRLGFSEGIAVNGNVQGFEINNNIVHDLTNIGIDIIGHEGTCSNFLNDQAREGRVKRNKVYNCISPYATSAGIYVDGGKETIIENNTVFNNGYGIEVGCEGVGKKTENIKVRNNIVYNNQNSGIAIGGYSYPNGSGKVKNVSVTNNTVFKNDYLLSGKGDLYLSYSENLNIENNIFYSKNNVNSIFAELGQFQLVFDYNLFFNEGNVFNSMNWNGVMYSAYVDFVSGTSTNGNSIYLDPKILQPSIQDPKFELEFNSPCIDSGNPNFSAGYDEEDLNGQNRIVGGRIDVGCHEYGNPNMVKVYLYPHAFYLMDIVTVHKIIKVEVYDDNENLIEAEYDGGILDISNCLKGIYHLHLISESEGVQVETIYKK